MMSWLRKIIFGLVLLTVIIYLFQNKALLKTISDEWQVSSNTNEAVSTEATTKEADKVKPTVKAKKITTKSTNAAADGLSKFYASINPDMNKKGPRIIKGVIYLPEPDDNLTQILEDRLQVVLPLKSNWIGPVVSRPFRKGFTLFQKLSENAALDKLEVIWWLNRDLVINDPFRINKDILKTAYQLGEAMEGHFINGVSTYFCYNHKAIIVIEGTEKYLDENCRLLTSINGY
jgi:hypothetical protein